MTVQFKNMLLLVLRGVGVFALARRLTRSRLRILCYHGISLADEHEFRPGVYMHPETFRRRMKMIKARGYPVLGLQEALVGLEKCSLPDGATVITVDDGWMGTKSVAARILQDMKFPSTLYVTTYYLKNRTQVFNMALAYLFMKARGKTLNIGGLAEGLEGAFDLGNEDEREICLDQILAYGETLDGAQLRQELLESVADRLNLAEALDVSGLFRIISREEAAGLPVTGMDIQLHTHRHGFPAADKALAEKEIRDNLSELSGVAEEPLTHFCYPSGKYVAEHAEWLKEWGIKSATTCDVGLNNADTNSYFLKRILDSENLSDIEIEAELCGLMEFKRIFVR